MGRKVTFDEEVILYQQALGIILMATKKPLTTKEELRRRNSLFQQKRTSMKQCMHITHLARKARREARQAKRQTTEN